MPSQLPLALVHPAEYGRDSFLEAPSNAAALALVERWPDWIARVAVVSGPPGCGKTHLAHIWAERARAPLIRAADLDPGQPAGLRPGSGLVVEDVDPDKVPEPALFHLINSANEHGATLLLTARAPPDEWRIGVSDLRSRLRLAALAALGWPDEDLIRKVLVKLFADRQVVVDAPVLAYILTRMERSLSAAASIVDALDREGLARGSPITRPMAARVIARLAH